MFPIDEYGVFLLRYEFSEARRCSYARHKVLYIKNLQLADRVTGDRDSVISKMLTCKRILNQFFFTCKKDEIWFVS